MTEKLYEQDPFLVKFETKVLSCEKGKKGFDVILDRTAFYPEGGGQPYDTGTLGGVKVLEVHNREGEIVHTCDAPLEPGRTITGVIDWDRRFDLMQQHSGEHIVSGLAHSLIRRVTIHENDRIDVELRYRDEKEQLLTTADAGEVVA